MMTTDGGWPAWLPVGALRVVRSSSRYEETVRFYRDRLGLTVLETFSASHGEDGTILGLPAAATHLEIVRSAKPASAADEFDQLVFYLPSRSAVQEAVATLQRAGLVPETRQHSYWVANGGVTFRDPDGRGVVLAPWIYGLQPDPSPRT
jgi:catechol 2,3-dioxygenase-like lactoylglutathione lyase family enzyme